MKHIWSSRKQNLNKEIFDLNSKKILAVASQLSYSECGARRQNYYYQQHGLL